MAQFEVLESNRKLKIWLGIYSNRLTEPTNEFFNSIATYYILFHALTILIATCAAVIFKEESQFEIASDAAVVAIAGFQFGGMFLSTGLKMKKIKFLHLTLQRTVDQCTTFEEQEDISVF